MKRKYWKGVVMIGLIIGSIFGYSCYMSYVEDKLTEFIIGFIIGIICLILLVKGCHLIVDNEK